MMAQAELIAGEPTLVVAKTNHNANKLALEDRAFHDWYRFVLSFPPHLVRDYAVRFGLERGQIMLDPFCGTGTTVVEAKRQGFPAIGFEANAMAHFASQVKTNWSIDPEQLMQDADAIAATAEAILQTWNGAPLRTLPNEAAALLLTDSISPRPLHKALVLRDVIDDHGTRATTDHLRLALAKTLVFAASNLHFGPEVGVQRTKLVDAPVVERWVQAVRLMTDDLRTVHTTAPPVTVHHADARQAAHLVEPASIDAVFTSPPYPNEKDYTRTTRLESVVLGFIHNKAELQALKKGLLRSNTRNVYKQDADDAWVADHDEIQAIAAEIERRRVEMGKTSGFERLYGRVTKLYFGGMARHLADLRPLLKPGAYLGYVVGDQASYLQVLIQTGRLLGEIAASLGYEVIGLDLFRTRLATATKQQMREEVLLLRWPG